MHAIARACLIAAALVGGALSTPALALDSASASYRNTRSTVDVAGRRKTSPSYRGDGAVGQISINAGASPSYSKRDGFEGVEYYPGKIVDLWGSSTAVIGGVYLQWTAHGDDGEDAGTKVRGYVVKYSTDPAQSPAASDANFNAAPSLPPPAPLLRGSLQTVVYNGLTAAGTYYFAVKSIEADGLRSVISNGATVHPLLDVWPPAPVVDLALSSTPVEGQLVMTWTAPDSNNNALSYQSPVNGYMIRIATFSVVSIGGSTTTWWNAATSVTQLSTPAISVAPPAPLFPGATQQLVLNQLWAGVTYYAMIVSSDEVGNLSGADVRSIPPGVQAHAAPYDPPPPPPFNLVVSSIGASGLAISWSSAPAYDINYYRVYVDSQPPYNFSHAWITPSFSTSTTILGLSTGTYIVRVTAVEYGAPQYPGVAEESVPTSSVTITLTLPANPPMEPYGIAISSAGGSVMVRWLPVIRFASGANFAVSTAPTALELTGYGVFRATSPTLGGWTNLGYVSTATWTWTDATGGPGYYYHVVALNGTGVSARSVVRTLGSRSAFVVAPDDQSSFEILSQDVAPEEGVAGDPSSAYRFVASSHPEDLGGRVIKSIEIVALNAGTQSSPDFGVGSMGWLRMHYTLASATGVTPSGLFADGVAATPQNVSVYRYDGQRWLQLFGTVDTQAQTVLVQTKYAGRYQLRTVERTGGFAFNQAGVSNRFVTPNGDGKNDSVVFVYDNPAGGAVSVKILDLRGKTVVAELPQGPVTNSREWDGRSGGAPVPGGVYIYKISGDGRTYTGTVVVVR